MKRVLSFLLVMVMLMGVVFTAPVSVGATETDTSGEEVSSENEEDVYLEYTIYCVDYAGWGNISATLKKYNYDDDGVLVDTAVETANFYDSSFESEDGTTIYVADVSTEYDKIVFGDGDEITLEETELKQECVFDNKNNQWYDSLEKVTGQMIMPGEDAKFTSQQYEYYVIDGYAYISEYNGADNEEDKVDLTLPEFIDGYPVTGVLYNAISDKYGLRSLTVPANITYLEAGFVNRCSNLEIITVDDANQYFDDYGSNIVVKKDTMHLLAGCNYSTIIDGIKIIGEGVFEYCRDLQIDVFPESVEVIKNSAFLGCDSIESINIHKNIRKIGQGAFNATISAESIVVDEENKYYNSGNGSNCLIETATNTLLQGCNNSVIPDTVTAIADCAFQYCYEFAGPIGANVQTVGFRTFDCCYAMTELYIPASLTDISTEAFISCEGLRTITVADDNPVYDSRNNCNGIIETETDKLILGCKKTLIPSDVKIIGGHAYDGASDIYAITIPKTINSIEEDAFFNCISLRRITIKNKDCQIIDSGGGYTIPEGIIIRGYVGSPAEEYATTYGRTFEDIEELNELTVYFVNTSGWSDVTAKVNYWGDDENYQPSIAEATEETDIDGNPVYAITFSEFDYDEIIFSDPNNAENVSPNTYIEPNWYYHLADETWYATLDRDDSDDSGDYEDLAPGYYLIGTIQGSEYTGVDDSSWGMDFEENPEVDGEWILNYYLYDGDSLQVVYYDGTEVTQTFTDKDAFPITADLEGECTIYFRPAGNEDWNPYYYLNVTEHRYASGYYLIGMCGGDFVDIDREISLSENEEGEYSLDGYFYENDSFTVVRYSNQTGEIEEYYWPKEGQYYIVTAEEEGRGTLYFDPDGKDNWSYKYLYLEKSECEHDYNKNGVCNNCGELKDGMLAGVSGYTLSLGGKISVNFYMVLSGKAVYDEEFRMVFTVPDTGETYDVELELWQANHFDNYHVFNCEVAAKEMTSIIKAQVVTSDDKSDIFEYSVKQYVETMLADPETYEYEIPLAKAMLNYGAYSQIYFDYKTTDLANNSQYMSEDDKCLVNELDLSEYKPYMNGEQEGVTYYGSSLSLESGTAIKHYFVVDCDPESLMISVDGYEATLTKNGDLYELVISDIFAQDLGYMYDVQIGDITINYGAFSYGLSKLNNGDEKTQNVIKALYTYYEQAENYIYSW